MISVSVCQFSLFGRSVISLGVKTVFLSFGFCFASFLPGNDWLSNPAFKEPEAPSSLSFSTLFYLLLARTAMSFWGDQCEAT